MSESIYLDNHSATKPCQPALDRMKVYLEEEWGASYAPHRMGYEQIASLDGRMQLLYDLVGARPEDRFAFTASGAEAIQQVLWSVYLEVARKEGKCHFATSCLEDAPTIHGLKRLEELGCFVKSAPVDREGCIDVEKLSELINPRTALVSISLAQGLTGVVQPLDAILKLCEDKKVFLHVDATYAIGKIPLSFSSDYLTFAGDRMHGLKSSGALFAKAGRPLSPLVPGAFGIDIPSLVSLSAAAQQSLLTLDSMGLETARLRDRLEKGIIEHVPGAKVLFATTLRLPNVTVISFPKVHQEALLYALNRKKVFASIGGAYHQNLSRLLMASGHEEIVALGAVSFALSRMTTESEIDQAIIRIAEAVAPLQSLAGDL
jgi:cysteine desulfurase